MEVQCLDLQISLDAVEGSQQPHAVFLFEVYNLQRRHKLYLASLQPSNNLCHMHNVRHIKLREALILVKEALHIGSLDIHSKFFVSTFTLYATNNIK